MAETMRGRLEQAENERLAPWAIRSAGASRRYALGDRGRAFDYRTHFQRDRDRILYSRAFRRLRQKARAGALPPLEDHRRNRLTHTLEVAQLGRTIGRALGLNEDLIEAVALAHDLGHPAFGEAGERALDDLLSGRLDGRGGPGHGDLGGFWRAWQSLRVVDLLEKRYEHPGLNLTDEVRGGILASGGRMRQPPEPIAGLRPDRGAVLEVQVVVLADRLACALGDLDDALQSGTLDPAHVEKLTLLQELKRKMGPAWRERAGRFMRANAIHRGLTHLLVTGAILHAERTLPAWASANGLGSPADFARRRDEALTGDEIGPGPATLPLLEDLEGFLEARVRRGREADRLDTRGRHVFLGLFAAYHADPTLLDDPQLLRFKERTGRRYLRDLPRDAVEAEVAEYRQDPRFSRLLADHLAGMTDAYALAEHTRLSEMGAVPIPSAEQLRRERS